MTMLRDTHDNGMWQVTWAKMVLAIDLAGQITNLHIVTSGIFLTEARSY